MSDASLPLAAEFPAATEAQWRKLVADVLDGASFEERLIGRTADGLTIEPLYARAADARAAAGRRPGTRWQVMQRLELPDTAGANAQARHELTNGVDGLVLTPPGAVGARGYWIESSGNALARALDGIDLLSCTIECEFSAHAVDLPLALAALVTQRDLSPAAVNIRFGIDPIGALAVSGRFPHTWNDFAPRMARMIAQLSDSGFKGPFAAADGRIVHGAGGTEAQELGFVLAVALAYLRMLEANGVALERARGIIAFRLAADADQFMTIAKFRALRKLWRRIEESCGLAPEPIFVAAETAWRSMTRNDPYTNILRATIAVFAAGIGAADAITVLPFTAARGLPDRFARRVARHTQLVLQDESNLACVADPSAGTGWSEKLTTELCRAGWALLQEIEGAGGIVAALEQGLFQDNVAAARRAREQALAAGKEALVGATEFPATIATDAGVLALAPRAEPDFDAAISVAPLSPVRLAAAFES